MLQGSPFGGNSGLGSIGVTLHTVTGRRQAGCDPHAWRPAVGVRAMSPPSTAFEAPNVAGQVMTQPLTDLG